VLILPNHKEIKKYLLKLNFIYINSIVCYSVLLVNIAQYFALKLGKFILILNHFVLNVKSGVFLIKFIRLNFGDIDARSIQKMKSIPIKTKILHFQDT